MWRNRRNPLLLAAAFVATSAAADDALTLRINDAVGQPGGLAAVVLRTYAPRGVEQGQICLRAAARLKAAAPTPFAVLEDVVVFSEAGDAQSSSSFDPAGQTAVVAFSSASGSVNLSDGPLAVFFFRLDEALAGGEEFAVELDLAETFLVGAGGASVTIDPRSGVVAVRPAGAPRHFGAEGDTVLPGQVAVLGAGTDEAFSVSGGQVTFLYDPAFAAGAPTVVMDPRYGSAVFDADTSVAGRVVVSFLSADSSLNQVPGSIVTLLLPVTASVALGARSTVELDPSSTWLDDTLGHRINLELASDVLEIGAVDIVFADSFESGDLLRWSF